jgi:hypothetical protein
VLVSRLLHPDHQQQKHNGQRPAPAAARLAAAAGLLVAWTYDCLQVAVACWQVAAA